MYVAFEFVHRQRVKAGVPSVSTVRRSIYLYMPTGPVRWTPSERASERERQKILLSIPLLVPFFFHCCIVTFVCIVLGLLSRVFVSSLDYCHVCFVLSQYWLRAQTHARTRPLKGSPAHPRPRSCRRGRGAFCRRWTRPSRRRRPASPRPTPRRRPPSCSRASC